MADGADSFWSGDYVKANVLYYALSRDGLTTRGRQWLNTRGTLPRKMTCSWEGPAQGMSVN